MFLVTVTIGRNVADVPMSLNRWHSFAADVAGLLRMLPGGDQGHAEVFGPFDGVGHWDGVAEDSTTYTALISHPDVDAFSVGFTEILSAYAARYDQDAIAWSYGPAMLATRS